MKRHLFLIFRGPNTVGWQLTAKLSKISNADQKELANAKITLKGTETAGRCSFIYSFLTQSAPTEFQLLSDQYISRIRADSTRLF